VLALALAVTGTFEPLAILANAAALALYLGCVVAAWRLRATAGTAGGARLPLTGIAPFLAAPVILWLFTGLTRSEWIGFGGCVAGASVVYLIATARR
jgi:hypothetical protein